MEQIPSARISDSSSGNPKSKIQNPKFRALLICLLLSFMPANLFAQSKPLRELTVSYPIGGSTSFFWVAHRSGSFEKHGVRLRAVHIAGSVAAIQAMLSREIFIGMEGGPAGVRAWARGAKELVAIAAVGNKLDYQLVSIPSIKRPEDLKGKRIGVSAIGASSDFIARHAVRQLGLNPERDVSILAAGAMGSRWAAISGGNLEATVVAAAVYFNGAQGRPDHAYRFVQAGVRVSDFDDLDDPLIYQKRAGDRDELPARPGRRHGLLPR